MDTNRRARFAVLAAALVAMLGVGMLTVSANVAGFGDNGPLFFAQNGNGNGGENGNGNAGNPGNSGNAPGNNGQGNGNPPANPGNAGDAPGNTGQGNGNPPENPGNSENAPGSQVSAPAESDDEDAPAEVANPNAEQSGAEKVNVCHVTDEETGDTEMISVSVNAVPAHESHGDEMIGVASEEECPEVEEPIEEELPGATPVPDEGTDEGDDGDDDGDEEDDDGVVIPGTPESATPIATPEIG